jgi:hypothetical protein
MSILIPRLQYYLQQNALSLLVSFKLVTSRFLQTLIKTLILKNLKYLFTPLSTGDLHGDISKTRRAFRVAGLIDHDDRWSGGTTVAVQVGDILDRGDQEIEIFYFLERLQREADAAGGALHILNGNHETMNVAHQFRYVTPGGYQDFHNWAQTHALEAALKGRCGCHHGHANFSDLRKAMGLRSGDGLAARSAALQPGGPITSRFIAPHPVVLQVGTTVFVHGGLLPQHVEYGIERMNKEAREWFLKGPIKAKPQFLSGREAVVWARDYSHEDASRCDCEALQKALDGVAGAKRVVVGHTIQSAGINSACGGRVLRIDVGLSKGCGDGAPEVLEILNDKEVRRLRESAEKAEMRMTKGNSTAAAAVGGGAGGAAAMSA